MKCGHVTFIDHVSNSNGDLLIDFLVDFGICMVNVRIGENKFAHVSHRGNSVVDHYVLTPYEQLIRIKDLRITYMSDLINHYRCREIARFHSALTWSVSSNIIEKHGENISQPAAKKKKKKKKLLRRVSKLRIFPLR